jgi:hypothetical protein
MGSDLGRPIELVLAFSVDSTCVFTKFSVYARVALILTLQDVVVSSPSSKGDETLDFGHSGSPLMLILEFETML